MEEKKDFGVSGSGEKPQEGKINKEVILDANGIEIELDLKEKVGTAELKEKKEEEEKVKIGDPNLEKKEKKKFTWKWFHFTILGAVFLSMFLGMVYFLVFSRSFFTVKIIDLKTSKALSEVSVEINGIEKETDNLGKARFDDLKPGENLIKVSLEGYVKAEEKVNLKRGNNGEFIVSLDLILIDLSGGIFDYIDKQPIEEATLTVRGESVKTDSEGKFEFKDVVPGNQEIKVTKEGYLERNLSTVGIKDTELGDSYLVPSNKVVFVSNRDGNKAVYSGYLNGDQVEKIWPNKKDFDDYQAKLSPDNQYIVFWTNRDGEKNEYGEYEDYLYLNSVSGNNLVKVAEERAEVSWFDDSSGFVYSKNNYDNDSNQYDSKIKTYEVATKKLNELFSDKNFETKNQASSSAYFNSLKVVADYQMVFMVQNNSWYDQDKTGIYKASNLGSGLTKLTDKKPYDYYLTPDKTKIQFMYYQNPEVERYEIDLATGKETQIELEVRKGYSLGQGYYSYEEKESPNGEMKVYIDYRDGKNDLYLTDKEGNNERRLSVVGGVNNFEFVGDKYVVFHVNKSEESSVYIVGLQGGNEAIKVTEVSEFVGVI